jgi:hypothetical protein
MKNEKFNDFTVFTIETSIAISSLQHFQDFKIIFIDVVSIFQQTQPVVFH